MLLINELKINTSYIFDSSVNTLIILIDRFALESQPDPKINKKYNNFTRLAPQKIFDRAKNAFNCLIFSISMPYY